MLLRTVLLWVVFATGLPAGAQTADREGCLRSVAIVQQAVEMRAAGRSKADTRAMLRDALDPGAGDRLAEFVWTLPEDQLDARVAEAWRARCDAL